MFPFFHGSFCPFFLRFQVVYHCAWFPLLRRTTYPFLLANPRFVSASDCSGWPCSLVPYPSPGRMTPFMWQSNQYNKVEQTCQTKIIKGDLYSIQSQEKPIENLLPVRIALDLLRGRFLEAIHMFTTLPKIQMSHLQQKYIICIYNTKWTNIQYYLIIK